MKDQWINYTMGMELSPIATNNQQRGNENGILFLVEHYLLKNKLGLLTEQDRNTFIKIVDNLQVTGMPGLYDRGQGESDPNSSHYVLSKDRRIISHDNLTAISCGSLLFNTCHRKDIAKHLLKYLGRFDNKSPKAQKINEGFQFHPRDIFMYLHNAGGGYRLLSYIFFPLFFISMLEAISSGMTCRPDILRSIVEFFKNGFKFPKRHCFINSSGPLLYFVRLEYGASKSILLKIVKFVCYYGYRRLFGKNWIKFVFNEYFKNKQHPNRILGNNLRVCR